MSLDATNWAWRVELNEEKGGCRKPLKRLVLLSLADRAGEDHCCYPSMKRLEVDTQIERKTVLKVIAELVKDGLIADTGERKGITKQVKVYKLVGINGRETVPTTEQSQKGNSSNNGTPNSANNGMPNSPNNGTQNLPIESPNESKNKKTWICFKKLGDEFRSADDSIDFHSITISNWFEREKRAFEIYNAGKDLCVDLLNFYFADWLINAYRTKYSESAKQPGQKFSNQSAPKASRLSDKQISIFATKLAHHPEFAGRYGEPGESYEKLAAKIAVKLQNPAQAKKWEQYLKQVGFTGQLEDAA